MNLMKLFNINFLKQNFKKSKVILSIFVGLIPILNTICMIMNFYDNNTTVYSFSEISIINFIGIYILPVIVSICLFNYIYKKKSVDFINSMPISRRSVFVTNTIFGILIFLSMLIVNVLLMLILTFVFNIPIPFMMLFDYLWYWFIIYIFTFSATNLAMTVSGNAITQIVVTLLLVFLMPFTHLFTTALYEESGMEKVYIQCDKDECIPEKYFCYDDLECNINKNANIYQIDAEKLNENNYTSPFAFIYSGLMGEGKLINGASVIKMVILSIIYIVLGYISFVKRKMEVSETSFKNIHVHNIVKSLTLVPVIAFSYTLLRYETIISIIFVLIIILIYYFVYDLITKKSITNIKLSLIYFIITISFLTITFSLIEISGNKTDKQLIKYTDIKEVAVNISFYQSGYFKSDIENIYINDKELINIIVKNTFNDYRDETKKYYLKTYFKTKNNDEYREYISISEEDYNKVIDILSKNKEYLEYYKNIDLDKVYAVKIGDNLYSKDDAKVVLDLVKDTLYNLSLKELFKLQEKYTNVNDEYYIRLYTYQNHDKQEFNVNGYINYDLLNSIVNSNNALLKDNISSVVPEDYYIYYNDSYLINEYEFDYYLIKNAKKELYNFMLDEVKKEVDMKKEFITFELNLNGEMYLFTTNNISGFKEILKNKYEEIKDSEEYKNYYNDYEEYGIEVKEYGYDY